MIDTPPPSIAVEANGDVLILEFKDRRITDQQALDQIEDYILELTKEGHRRFVLDLGNVDYLSSAFVGTFVRVKKQMPAVSRPSGQESSQESRQPGPIKNVFGVYKDRDAALSALAEMDTSE